MDTRPSLVINLFHIIRLEENPEEDEGDEGVTAAAVAAVFIVNSAFNLKRKDEVGFAAYWLNCAHHIFINHVFLLICLGL